MLGYTSESKVRPLHRVYVSVTIYPRVVFLLIEFPLRQQKSLYHLLSALLFLLTLLHTLAVHFRSQFQFSIYTF